MATIQNVVINIEDEDLLWAGHEAVDQRISRKELLSSILKEGIEMRKKAKKPEKTPSSNQSTQAKG